MKESVMTVREIANVEIAHNGCYTVKKTADMKSYWLVKPAAALYKNDNLHKIIPSRIYRD